MYLSVSKFDDEKIENMYLSGVSASEIAVKIGSCATTVFNRLKLLGIIRRKTSLGLMQDKDKISEMYLSGESMSDIAYHFKTTYQSIGQVLTKAGITNRPKSGRGRCRNTKPSKLAEHKEQISLRYCAGETSTMIAKSFHCSGGSVLKFLHAIGIRIRGPRERHVGFSVSSETRLKISQARSNPSQRQRDVASVAHTVHGHSASLYRGTSSSPTFSSWASMKSRCKNFLGYIDNGTKVLYPNFAAFLSDVGIRPDGTTIDRICPFGHYEQGNCRWATRSTQGKNKRKNHICTSSCINTIKDLNAT